MSEHFSMQELTFSSTAERLGIDNEPNAEVAAVLLETAELLEQVRELLGKAMHIDSGYRCPLLNHAVGGAGNSAHMTGYAVDFICPDYGYPLEIVKTIEGSGIKFDQLIQEGTWVHISFAPTMRQMVMTAHFENGTTTYTHGA
jgi:hypothetical protein